MSSLELLLKLCLKHLSSPFLITLVQKITPTTTPPLRHTQTSFLKFKLFQKTFWKDWHDRGGLKYPENLSSDDHSVSGTGLSLANLWTRGMLAVRKGRRKLRMGTICSPHPSGTKIASEVCNADWMALLPAHLHNVPLSNLAIPGSHDSFSYWVDEKSPAGPDQTAAIKHLARISLVKKLMKKWSVTQNLTFRQQLEAGIRYFDLRVSSKPRNTDQEIYFIHGLFGIKVSDGMMEIDAFLTQHPQEIVFLDFNHFYAMDEAHHRCLILQIQEAFGNKLCPAFSVESMMLQTLWEKKCQVLIFYHCPVYKQYPFLWPGKKIPAPWANTTSVHKLILFLETTLSKRAPSGFFHVSQAILTPRMKTIARGLAGGLRDTLVHRNLPAILDWVKMQKAGATGVNIVTSDFVDLVDFATTVIELNNTL